MEEFEELQYIELYDTFYNRNRIFNLGEMIVYIGLLIESNNIRIKLEYKSGEVKDVIYSGSYVAELKGNKDGNAYDIKDSWS